MKLKVSRRKEIKLEQKGRLKRQVERSMKLRVDSLKR